MAGATIRHVIVFNATALEAEVRAMAARAWKVLGPLPGVTEVLFGAALAIDRPFPSPVVSRESSLVDLA